MSTFILVSDPDQPTAKPWWTVLLVKGNHAELDSLHKLFTRQFLILDGRDPHNQSDRDRAAKDSTFCTADLRHPVRLSGLWMTTAISLFTRGDVLISSRGGMRPRDGTVKEWTTLESKEWPKNLNDKRRIDITTWGNHYYLVCREIAFAEKYDTEQEAMDVAKLFAPIENIKARKETKSFKDGD